MEDAMNKLEFLRSVEREYFIIKLIYEQLAPGDLAFRTTANQRSIEELLRYLSWCGYEAVRKALAGKDYVESKHKKAAETYPIDTFPGQVNEQFNLIIKAIGQISDEDWRNRPSQYWGGQEASLQAALVETTLKWLTAYRMNLFLFAKAAGHAELDRKICWAVPDGWA
jgi:hypothetical protein